MADETKPTQNAPWHDTFSPEDKGSCKSRAGTSYLIRARRLLLPSVPTVRPNRSSGFLPTVSSGGRRQPTLTG